MKKIILIIFLLLFQFSLSQEEYPTILVDSLGNKYVTFTIKQTKKLDKKLDILELLKESNQLSNDIDSVYIQVINEKNIIIAKQNMQISKLDSLTNIKDDKIKNLKDQILSYKLSEYTYKQQLVNRQEKIEIYSERVDNLEKKTLWGGIGGGALITILIGLLISN